MKKALSIFLVLFSIVTLAKAQDFPYGKVTDDEINMKKYDKDTSAHAVVLHEFGKAAIALVGSDNFIRLVYEYHVKIKIINSKGFDSGTFETAIYHSTGDPDNSESMEDITGVTFYKDDNGGLQKIELDKSNIFQVKEGNNGIVYKFTMPGLRNGCIIEYKYKKISPYFNNFHPWYFQSDIPKIYSEYEAHIPAYFRYNISLKGNLKLIKKTATVEQKCFMVNSGGGPEAQGADCSVFNYAMADVPALVSEEYMTAPKNFMAVISFALTDYTDPYNEATIKKARQWHDVDYTLKSHIFFGDQLKKKALFKDRIVPVIAGKGDDLDKSKAVYSYIQQLFKWDKTYDEIYSLSISKALEKHTGDDADINLSLVVALNAAGLNASTVLLSTRDHGTINSLYPSIDDFNYVVARVDIGDQNYLLDATDPLLSFGTLPLKCLNGKGRVFSLDKPSYFMDINPPQKEKTTKTLDFTLQDDGTLKGTLINYSTGYDAYEKRVAIKKFNTTDEYVEDFNSKTPRVKVLKSEISNLDSLELPLIEKYDLEINIADKLNGNSQAFNPFFWDKLKVNPFTLAERSYPVDFGMPSDQRLTLTIHLPAGYIVDSPPQAVAVSLPENGGKFVTNYEAGDNSFSFSHVIQLNKPIYDPGEYPYLKELYNKIIQSEKSEIIFKKR